MGRNPPPHLRKPNNLLFCSDSTRTQTYLCVARWNFATKILTDSTVFSSEVFFTCQCTMRNTKIQPFISRYSLPSLEWIWKMNMSPWALSRLFFPPTFTCQCRWEKHQFRNLDCILSSFYIHSISAGASNDSRFLFYFFFGPPLSLCTWPAISDCGSGKCDIWSALAISRRRSRQSCSSLSASHLDTEPKARVSVEWRTDWGKN